MASLHLAMVLTSREGVGEISFLVDEDLRKWNSKETGVRLVLNIHKCCGRRVPRNLPRIYKNCPVPELDKQPSGRESQIYTHSVCREPLS